MNKTEFDLIKKQVADLVGQKPEKAARVLSDWLNQATHGVRRHLSGSKAKLSVVSSAEPTATPLNQNKKKAA